jgi:hypothetical protein
MQTEHDKFERTIREKVAGMLVKCVKTSRVKDSWF